MASSAVAAEPAGRRRPAVGRVSAPCPLRWERGLRAAGLNPPRLPGLSRCWPALRQRQPGCRPRLLSAAQPAPRPALGGHCQALLAGRRTGEDAGRRLPTPRGDGPDPCRAVRTPRLVPALQPEAKLDSPVQSLQSARCRSGSPFVSTLSLLSSLQLGL